MLDMKLSTATLCCGVMHTDLWNVLQQTSCNHGTMQEASVAHAEMMYATYYYYSLAVKAILQNLHGQVHCIHVMHNSVAKLHLLYNSETCGKKVPAELTMRQWSKTGTNQCIQHFSATSQLFK